VESPGRKEFAQDQWLEHDLIAKVVSTFGVHALAIYGLPPERML
jgi:hypothetical protein